MEPMKKVYPRPQQVESVKFTKPQNQDVLLARAILEKLAKKVEDNVQR